MIPPEGILRFLDRQKRLLRATYDDAWSRGVDAYEPDADPATTPSLPRDVATGGLSGMALLGVLRQYPYVPPGTPDPVRRTIALAAAFVGLNRMGAELSTLPIGADPTQALQDWVNSNGSRLDMGSAVAWAGEQNGYAEAANTDGQVLYAWLTEGDERVCSDCEILASYPPMPLDQWPTSPGAGDTSCVYGCRCSWDTWSDTALPDNYQPTLNADQEALANSLADDQAQTLADMMAEAAYLE